MKKAGPGHVGPKFRTGFRSGNGRDGMSSSGGMPMNPLVGLPHAHSHAFGANLFNNSMRGGDSPSSQAQDKEEHNNWDHASSSSSQTGPASPALSNGKFISHVDVERDREREKEKEKEKKNGKRGKYKKKGKNVSHSSSFSSLSSSATGATNGNGVSMGVGTKKHESSQQEKQFALAKEKEGPATYMNPDEAWKDADEHFAMVSIR